MNKPSVNHEEATIESFRRDPDFALAYLNDVLEDGDEEECLLALRRVVEALGGGVAKVAREARLNEKSLHRTLSAKGNPTWKSLFALNRALGIRMSFSRTSAPSPRP